MRKCPTPIIIIDNELSPVCVGHYVLLGMSFGVNSPLIMKMIMS